MPTLARTGRVRNGPIRSAQFFAGPGAPGHLATFEGESATLRFDVRDGASGQHWHVDDQRRATSP